ncbi:MULTISPECIES: hypothetical protein [Burkholderia]|uniref:Uncharacterized protein n=1 Tax=Burkholderia anthina TaxID=179879 RepID=A0A7T6VMG5_9BURK|nr:MULTISPECIES: hypothetical protein [Burkholderia]MBY4865159.1 hypothetical protein [Burkholderia anthina]QQK06629.1 hypothetical protein JFN94_22700 [Burkholderia anthina]
MDNTPSRFGEQSEPAELTKNCIHCAGSLRIGSIRCRMCGSEDPFGSKTARKRSALLHGMVMAGIFSALFCMVYGILPVVTLYLRHRN